MEKLTNVKALEIAIKALDTEGNEELVEKLTKMKDSFAKKSANKSDKPTKTQTENKGFKEAILNGMEDGRKYTISEMIKEIDEISELSNQRVSAIVRQLREDGFLVREEIKRKAYFTKVA